MQKYIILVFIGTFVISATAFAGVFDDAVSGNVDVSAGSSGESDVTDSDNAAGSTSPPTIVSPLSFDLNGYVRGDLFAGKMPDYSRAEMKNGYGELALKVLVSKGSKGSAFADVRFKGGYLKNGYYLGQPTDSPIAEEDLGKAAVSVQLREAYVNIYAKRLELRLGHQIVLWGRADGINPTNNITPIDMRVRSPEEDDRRLANTGLVAKLNLSPVTIEGVWMPIYSASLVPQVVIGNALRFDKPDYPDFDLANGLFAGKIDFAFPAFEFSLSYLNGYSLTPSLTYVKNNFTEPYYDRENLPPLLRMDEYEDANGDMTPYPVRDWTITLARKAYKHQVVGFDFETTLGSFMGLRGEVAFRYPEKQDAADVDRIYVPNPDLYYVLGLDKEFGNLMVVAQYIGRYTLNYDQLPNIKEKEIEESNADYSDINLDNNLEELQRDQAAQKVTFYGLDEEMISSRANKELAKTNKMLFGQTAEIQHGVSLRLSYSMLHDTLTLVAFGMANLTTQEIVIYPKIEYKLTDAMTVTTGAELYFGPEDTLFGLIDETLSAGYAEFKVSF